jgi:hypothetical protein
MIALLLSLNLSCTTSTDNPKEERPLSIIKLISISREMLEKSTREYEKGNYQLSYNISNKILIRIDYYYQYDGLVDDTGMYIVLAEIKKKTIILR